MHAVMAVRAKEFEAQLQPADMPPHLLRQRECGIEVRGVDGQIKRRGHGLSAGKRSLGAGGMSFTGAAAGVGAGAGARKGGGEGKRVSVRVDLGGGRYIKK